MTADGKNTLSKKASTSCLNVSIKRLFHPAEASVIATLLEEPSVEREDQDAPALAVGAGQIEIKGVNFCYRSGEPVLSNLSLIAQGGRTTALVGRSGSGKSTIMSTLLLYWDSDAGVILIDGQDITQVSRASLRCAISYFSQETFLFKGTIRQNIALGRQEANEADIIAAAKAAYAHDFISAFEFGYDTQCGEHGMQLSGGQHQRIAIARAFLKNAPILLLDEANSALDTESERAVQEALDKLREGGTPLVIAHRLSTVRNADSICVIDRGHVAESGVHADLIAREDCLYAAMVRSQFSTVCEPAHGI
jgi:subfamily B ATP-binding cassette protein MsbA